MKLTIIIVLFLVIFTVRESPVNGQIWPWETTQGSLPTPSTNIDGSDGGVISLNYAFDVNNLIPNGIRNWIAGDLGTTQNNVLNMLGSFGGTNIETLKMLNAFMSSVDQFAQTNGANADTLAAQLNALRQQLYGLSIAQVQRSYSAASQSNSSLVPSVQSFSQNIVTQLSYLESIVSPTLPCASQAYSVLTEAARSRVQETIDCLNARHRNFQDNVDNSLRDIKVFIYYYGPKVYSAVQECSNNTGASLLISNVTKSSACWARAALRIKSDTITMLHRLTHEMAWHNTYRIETQTSLAECMYAAFDVFSTNTVNAGIQKLITCASAWNGSYNSSQTAAAK